LRRNDQKNLNLIFPSLIFHFALFAIFLDTGKSFLLKKLMSPPKTRILFQCQSCGYSSPKWLGKCPDCGAWNSFVEEEYAEKLKSRETAAPVALSEISQSTAERYTTEIKEFDRTLGGGVVLGSVILIGGDPGIGKSTLLLQALKGLTKLGNVLYVSGEESPEQIKMRADRLGVKSPDIILLPETSLEGIVSRAQEIKPQAIVIDSIQTVFSLELPSAPGSVSQIRENMEFPCFL
jgi:DNA repair protein RadA/Sms